MIKGICAVIAFIAMIGMWAGGIACSLSLVAWLINVMGIYSTGVGFIVFAKSVGFTALSGVIFAISGAVATV